MQTSRPSLARKRTRAGSLLLSAVLSGVVVALSGAAQAKPSWQPVAPGELAENTARVEPDAPAEILFWNIEVDDRDFPRERRTTEYIRYKIFAPEKVDHVTRVAGVEYSNSGDRTELHARLVLPSGRVQEFGREAIKERPLVQAARQAGFLGWLSAESPSVVEKFLAITGIERGAVLEFHITRVDQFPGMVGLVWAQREAIPVRQFDYRARLCPDTDMFLNRTFVTNPQGARLTEDAKARTVAVTASNLPAYAQEVLAGSATEQMLTILNCYEQSRMFLLPRSGKVPLPGKVDASLGPWATYATLMDWAERDRGFVTKRVKQLAAELGAGAAGDGDKAARIHRHVETLFQRYQRRTTAAQTTRREPNSLDDVIEWEKNPDVVLAREDFLWLAVSLYQSAGLEASTTMLPNREFARFEPTWVSPIFLPNLAAAVRIDGAWKFSSPHHEHSLPFGLLPWQQEGQSGLLAQPKKQEFINVPLSPPQASAVSTLANLEIAPDGALQGRFVRSFTGHTAVLPRAELRAAAEKDRFDRAKAKLGLDPKIVELTVDTIEGLDDPARPLEISCTLRWPEFAVRTRDRIIFRPAVFRTQAPSPFSAAERRRPVHFPFRWLEVDRLAIRLPGGYELETPIAPAVIPGPTLAYRLQLAVEKSKENLHVRREFASNVTAVATAGYPALKEAFDHVARSDQHELVLVKAGAGAAVSSRAPAESRP